MADYPHVWVLVADASRARIFEWTAPSAPLVEVADPANPQGRLKSSALDSDKPGVAADAQGHRSGHPMQAAQSAHEQSAEGFAAQIAAILADALAAKNYERLVLFAAPEFLGRLRAKLDPIVASVVAKSTALDLVRESPESIQSRLPKLTSLA
jgi:protein required for attachment to host cells